MRPSTWARGAVDSQSQERVRSAVNRLRLAVGIALVVLVTAPAHASAQLELIPNPPTLIVLMIGFVILIAPLNAMIFRPLFRVLDEREAKIAGATEEAGHLVTRATELTEDYRGAIREAREVAEGARKQQLESARAEHASITGDARTESEGEISRAREEIEVGLVEARATLEATSRDLAKVAAERILGRPLQ
jgi:F-type H+-transporting ATPase subunit b